MTVTIEPAAPDDLDAVFCDLSAQSRNEIDLIMRQPDDVQKELRTKVEHGGAQVSYDDDGSVLTVFGFNDFDHYWSMWSVATPKYYAMGADSIRKTRAFFESLILDKPLIVTIASEDPNLARWMRLLGFEKRKEVGVTKVFTRRHERCI